jgi:hypothetical protein
MSGDKPPATVLPDAGPLITLAYADSLDLLLKPGWPVEIVRLDDSPWYSARVPSPYPGKDSPPTTVAQS